MSSRFRPGWLILLAALAACGQKGPLVLPDEAGDEAAPAEEPAEEAVPENG